MNYLQARSNLWQKLLRTPFSFWFKGLSWKVTTSLATLLLAGPHDGHGILAKIVGKIRTLAVNHGVNLPHKGA